MLASVADLSALEIVVEALVAIPSSFGELVCLSLITMGGCLEVLRHKWFCIWVEASLTIVYLLLLRNVRVL